MAVIEISEPTKFRRVFIGLTADVKPNNVQPGAIFLEIKVDNTILIYVTPDGVNWNVVDIGDDTISAEVAKIPKSDGAVSWNATALAAINTQIDLALQTIVPAAPTAGSLNDILSKASGGNTFVKATDSLEMLSDKLGGYSGDGGAAADDSVKAELDLVKTATDKLAGAAPGVGSTTANWQTAEADLISIGTDNVKNKLHSLLIDTTALTAAALLTVRMYMQINGTERKVYEQQFLIGTDTAGLWVIQSSVGIHEVLRVSLQSNTAGDNGKAVGFDYMLEVM